MNKTLAFAAILITFIHLLCFNCSGGQIFPDKPFARLGKGAISQVAYSPDGKLLAVAGSVGIWLYDVPNLNEVGLLEGAVNSMDFSPDSKILASGGTDGIVRLWDTDEQKQIGFLQGHTGPVLAVAYRPDGSMLASISSDETVRLWNVESQQEVERFALPVQHAYGISISFSPDGKWLAAIGSDGKICLWDVELKKEIEDMDVIIRIYSASGALVRTLSPGRKAAGAYIDKGSAAYWDGRNDMGQRCSSGVYFYRLDAGHFSGIRKLAVTK